MKLRCKKPTKNKQMNSECGSSSVLVIMIMLLLITFGVLAMMSSYSNLKIARKHAQWTRDYYQLESIADSDFKSFEQLFGHAMDKAQTHFSDQSIDKTTFSDMPDALKATVMKAVDGIEPGDKASLNALADQLFLYHLYDACMTAPLFDKHYLSNFGYDIFTVAKDSKWVPQISFITKDETTQRQLFVKIAIDTHKDNILANTLSILEWREVPAEFKYDETLDFQDPEGN